MPRQRKVDPLCAFAAEGIECSQVLDCCDCGGNDCGCRGCWSCNACEHCMDPETPDPEEAPHGHQT
jgi:hypothetical protein